MFKDKAVQKSINWNLRRCINPKRFLKKVKKQLLYQVKHYGSYPDEDGLIHCCLHQRLSQEGFSELRILCQQEGIILSSEWKSPFIELYCFSIKVR